MASGGSRFGSCPLHPPDSGKIGGALQMLDFEQLELSDSDFENFRKLVCDKCGISLHEGKKELVRARIGKRLRETRFKSFRAYYRYLMDKDTGKELAEMLNAISTNLTSFFREQNHFAFLEKEVLPCWLRPGPPRPLHIWSAGCSSGEEAYSLAICFQEFMPADAAGDLKILATDISTKVIGLAESGIYHRSRIQNIPEHLLRKYFQKGHGHREGYFRVKPGVKRCVDFRRFNLMAPFAFENRFDVIFCRNVMIYFDKSAQEALVNKFYDCLTPGGYLFIGHSESLLSIRHPFKYIQPTIYRKP